MSSERLNAERKRDLEAHYEKEARLLGPRPVASGDVAASKPRKGLNVKFPEPYSRDPNRLFIQKTETGLHQPLPAPMNNNNKAQNNKGQVGLGNPVKYKNVHLARPLDRFDKGDFFEVATVENYRGQVMLYKTETDFLNGEPSFEEKEFRVPSAKRFNNQFHIFEILAFLQRGHSLLEPECRCKHEIDTERASDLGISMPRVRKGHPVIISNVHAGSAGKGMLPGIVCHCFKQRHEDRSSIRDDKCLLPTKRVARTSQELSYEIAVGDIYEIKDPKTGEYLIDALKRKASDVSSKIIFDDTSGKDLWFFKADGASCREELLALVNRNPLGYKEPEEKDAYNGVKADVEALAANKDVYLLTNAETKIRVMFPRDRNLQLEVSPDVKQLWKDCWQKAKSADLEQDLKAEGLASTKQEKPEKVVGKRKGTGRQRRTSKKNTAYDYLKRGLGGAGGA